MAGNNYQILIVEDSPTIFHVTSHRLMERGFVCEGCPTAEEGLERIQQRRQDGRQFDALLLDWHLPGLSGAEMAEMIRSDKALDALAIVVYSETPDESAYQLASDHPNNDIQLKSDLDQLPDRLDKFITLCKSNLDGALLDNLALNDDREETWKVLFVDDSATIRAKYSDLLKTNDYQVEVASNMDEALAKAKTFQPEIAINDYIMPGGNGDEVVRAMLSDPATSDVTPILFSQRNDILELGLEAGAIDSIWKDEPSHVFLMRIKAICRFIRSQRESTQLEVFKAATDLIGLGVIMNKGGAPQPFNDKMKDYMDDCRGLDAFVESRTRDLHLIDKDGRERHFEIFHLDIKDQGALVLVQDITARKLQEQEIIAAREQLNDALTSMSEGFCLYDAEDRLVLFNERYRKTYSASAEAIEIGATFEDIVRYGAEQGQYTEAAGRIEEFVGERVQQHLNPKGVIEQPLGDGRWLRIEERKTREGGIVGIRTDITRLK